MSRKEHDYKDKDSVLAEKIKGDCIFCTLIKLWDYEQQWHSYTAAESRKHPELTSSSG